LFEIFPFPSSNHGRDIDLKMTSRDIFIINPREFIFCLLFEIFMWRWRRNDCGGGVDAMIAAMSLVGAVIAVTAAFVQRLRQRGWLATAVIATATALAQGLRRRQRWRAAMAALAQ
jgi:hypothetical protein